MTVWEAKAAEAARLRSEGLLLREIAERMGISVSYAQALVSDPTGENLRERKRRYDRVCVDCGGRVDGTTPSKSSPTPRCLACARRHAHESRYWTPERVIAAIREHAIDGQAPGSRELLGSGLVVVAQREFGSWSAACEAAGFRPRRIGERRDPEAWRQAIGFWTRERIIEALRDNADGDTPPSTSWCQQNLGGVYVAAQREFGSWRAAVEAAGLTPRERGQRATRRAA